MTLEKIFVLFLILLFPALALANEPSQPSEEEFVQQESRVNILEGAADQKERVTVRGMSLREILIQRLREEHARGRHLDVQETAIAELSDTEIEEIFQRANAKGNEEETAVFDVFEGDANETPAQEFTTSGKALSWKDYIQWLLSGALGLVSGTTSWLAKGGFSYENEDGWEALAYESDYWGDDDFLPWGIAAAEGKYGESEDVVIDETSGLISNINTEKIWNFLKAEGFTNEGAAGILGNLYAESGCDPTRVEVYEGEDWDTIQATYVFSSKDDRGYGIVQWSDLSRKAGLEEMAASMNSTVSDLNVQIAFVMKEMESLYISKGNCVLWDKYKIDDGVCSKYDEENLTDALKKCDNCTEAAIIFHDIFEKSDDYHPIVHGNIDHRIKKANEFLNLFARSSY